MNTPATIADVLRAAARTLSPHSDSPRLDAELMLAKVLGLPRSALIARGDESVAIDCERAFDGLIARRMDGAPVAYLTGNREFWSLTLQVTPAVLVPRPETECLVERALELKPRDERCLVLDLGTGSGAIALAIASERPLWKVTGVDLSPQALDVAIRNAELLELRQVEWRLGCWFDAVPGERFDLIVANPPYVAAADPALAKLEQEPSIALRAGASGLDSLQAIIAKAAQHLHARGWLVLEHGDSQAPKVAQLLETAGFTCIRTSADYSGRPRVTLATV